MKAQDKRVENAHKIIGQNVKKAREKAGLTQLQLALAIGHKSVSLVSCAEIYHKKQHFNIEHLLKIAADTGLLISHAFNLKTIMGNELYLKLALGKLEVNEGMLVENVVAQMLKASGHELFFYSNNSKNSAEDRMEIDFLVSKPVITNRHNISPIEVKSSNSYTITSLNKLRTKFAQMLAESYVLHPADVEVKDGVVYLPLFMASLL